MGPQGRLWRLWPVVLLLPVVLLTLAGCSEDGDDPSVKGERTSIVVQQCVTGFDDHSATRAWLPPSPYVEYTFIYGTNGMFANQKNLVNKSIEAFFAKDGQATQEGVFFYRNSDSRWLLTLEDLVDGNYQVYGYIPKEDAESATVTPLDGSYNNGAVLTISGLSSVTPSDVCVVVGAKNDDTYNPAIDNYSVNDLAPGQFGVNFHSGESVVNHVFLLFDHLYAALRFNFKVDAVYDALRTIKLRKLELVAYADDSGGGVRAKFNATVTLRQNTRSMTKDQILLLIHDLHGETDLALKEKDETIGALTRRLDSLNRQQDSLTAKMNKLLEAQALLQAAADSAGTIPAKTNEQP